MGTTSKILRGVGDAVVMGAGSSIRLTGDVMHQLSAGVDGLSDAIAGDRPQLTEEADSEPTLSAADATRKLVSRPFRIVARAVRSTGDAINTLGDV